MGVSALSRIVRNMRYAGPTPERAGRHDELPLLERERAGARQARERGDAHHADRQHGVERAGAQDRDDDHREQDRGHRQEEVEHAHDRGVGEAAREAAEEAERHPHRSADQHRDRAGEERDARAVDHAAQDVPAELVGAEGVGEGRRPELVRPALGQGILGGDPGSQDSHDAQHRQHDTRGEPGAVSSGPGRTSDHGREQSTWGDPGPQGGPAASRTPGVRPERRRSRRGTVVAR